MFARRLGLVLLIVLLGWAWSQPAHAQPAQPTPIDVLLLIDDSGSMSDVWASGTRQPNDPLGLRHSAARLFIELARDGDRIGVISFHTDPTALGEAAEGRLTTIAGTATKRSLQATIVQPTEPPAQERLTDMRKALRLARELLTANRTDNRQFIVFLTDGRPWPPDQRNELLAVIKQLAADGVTIFPILLGNDVDLEVAKRMANATNGLIQQVDNAGDLLQAYARIYSFIQPERYVDEVELTGGRVATFRTGPDQGITNVSILLPKTPDADRGFADLTRNGQSVLDQEVLADGVTLTRSVDDHYEVVTLAHNAPLVGEWVATATSAAQAGASKALLVADSLASLILQYPSAADAASTAAPRYYPAGKPVLLAVAVEQAGHRITGLDVQAVLEGVQQPLRSDGLTADGSLYWTLLTPTGSETPGQRSTVQVQIGQELRPIRLLKEFTLVSAELPRLVADSPTERASGLEEDGRLLLKAHFEGKPQGDQEEPQLPEQATVVAYVADTKAGNVTTIELACTPNGVCLDRSFVPQQGTHYDVTFVATAVVNGTPYTDFAQGSLTMRDALRLDSLPPILDFGRIPPYESSIRRDVVLTAFTSQPVELEATLELGGAGVNLPPGALGLSLSRPVHREGNRYVSVLQLTGFDALPPGEYSGVIRFSSPRDMDIEPASVTIQFTIPVPEVKLFLPASPDLGDLARPGEPRQFTIQAEFSSGKPSDIEARLVELTSGGRTVDSSNFQVSVGAAQPVQAGARRFTLPVQLSAAKRPKPGLYQGVILFSSPEGMTVDPQRMQITFNVPQPVTSIMLPGDRLDFGSASNLSRPISASLTLHQTILDQPPPLRLQLVSLSHSRESELNNKPRLTVSSGAVRSLGEGQFRLPIYVSAVGKAVPGIYQGVLRIEAPEGEDVLVQPSEIEFVVRQLTPWQALLRRLTPVASFLRTWFVPLPLLRWQGIVGWLVLLVLVNTLLRLRPASSGARGMISSEETGKAAILRGEEPLYLVLNGNSVLLSRKKRDRSRAVALINFERQVDASGDRLIWRPVLRPNPLAPEPVRLAYWRRRSNRWHLVPEEGAPLWHGARFRLRLPESGARYHFRYAAQ